MTETQRLIHQLRGKRWSVSEIGRQVGVTDATIWRWLDGTRTPENELPVLVLLRGLVGRRPPKRPYVRREST